MFGLAIAWIGCGESDAPSRSEDASTADVGAPIGGTGDQWDPDPTTGDQDEPPPAEEADCTAQRFTPTDDRVLVDAAFECRSGGFGRRRFSVASVEDTALVAVGGGGSRSWVVRVSANEVVPLPGDVESLRDSVQTVVRTDGAALVSGTTLRESAHHYWELWAFEDQWQLLADIPELVRDARLEASPTGQLAVWMTVGGVHSIARSDNNWVLHPAAELEGATRRAFGLAPDGDEWVFGTSTDPLGRTRLFGASEREPMHLLGEYTEPVEFVLAAPTSARADAPAYALLVGTPSGFTALWPDTSVEVPQASMASPRCPFNWDEVYDPTSCEDCTEQGSGRLGQSVAVARTQDDVLLAAYIHTTVDRHFQYNYWCSNPDGEICSCETFVWDDGSTFELRVLAVLRDGRVNTLLQLPLPDAPDGQEATGPGDQVAISTHGDRAAVAVRLQREPLRALVLDLSDLDALAGS
jgi:hypothetical protein